MTGQENRDLHRDGTDPRAVGYFWRCDNTIYLIPGVHVGLEDVSNRKILSIGVEFLFWNAVIEFNFYKDL
jgi:hypothetical protein